MKPEYTVAAIIAAALALVAGLAFGADQPAPGVKRVCVPAEDGRTWECGTTGAPPPQRPVAPRDSPPPPSFLAPASGPEIMPLGEAASAQAVPIEAPRTDDFPSAPDRDTTAEDATATDEPLAEEATPADSTPPQTASSDASTSSDGAAAGPVATSEPPAFLQPPRRRGLSPGPPISPELPAEPVAEASVPERESIAPEPVVEAEPEAEDVAQAAPPEPAPTIAPSPQPERDSPGVRVDAPDAVTPVQPGDADAFRALAATGFTVQLAHAASPDGFSQAVADLGLDARDTYALPVQRDGKPWWTLVWSSFPDAASARAATARLPRNAGLNVGYPRRIALIQRELNP